LQSRIKRTLWILVFIILTSALSYGLGWSKLLALETVTITGTNQIKLIENQLKAAESKLIIGQPLARINPRTEENTIEDLEWIASADLSRNWWTGKVTVQVTPQIPVAIYTDVKGVDGAPRYLAKNGVEFSSPQTFSNLAKISMISTGPKSKGERRAIGNFVANLSTEIVTGMTGLEIARNNVILMETNFRKPSLTITWGARNSATDIEVKSVVLMGLLALPENKKITEIDLSIADSPIVK
jgi:cell division protein FtsQ